ncbi:MULTISPECIES: glycogen synthesis protein GlgS [Atlantibacter]|nr:MULTISPECIES: glycogen synthesis protein GlgS [Atlantibacter]MCQ4966082.1 glycogen synthesis protein GlgS [Enterobacteriaceae bacterium DFI.7.85]MDQ7881430.1 glycogen synthesis protein GlgS [Atlantibacter hermannii]MDU1953126.1 glycogen synthesis protein GlgS [Atlantibacter hermannii]MDU7391712.1 glycogen synthesis protein GlgS [Atlantibacter hermannii]MDU7813651.1 glycogen synthesis protein GlgS [Atlantibacter hermannii]
MSVQNFDFIAFSFARMQLRGRDVNLDNITGNMNATSKKWFQNRYNFYLSEFKDQSVKA